MSEEKTLFEISLEEIISLAESSPTELSKARQASISYITSRLAPMVEPAEEDRHYQPEYIPIK